MCLLIFQQALKMHSERQLNIRVACLIIAWCTYHGVHVFVMKLWCRTLSRQATASRGWAHFTANTTDVTSYHWTYRW